MWLMSHPGLLLASQDGMLAKEQLALEYGQTNPRREDHSVMMNIQEMKSARANHYRESIK